MRMLLDMVSSYFNALSGGRGREESDSSQMEAASKAYLKALPSLLNAHPYEWVAFSGEENLGVAKDKPTLYKQISDRHIPLHDVLIERIQPEREEIYLRL